MRVLLLPVYSNNKIECCTTYIIFKFVAIWLVTNKNVYVYFPIPKDIEKVDESLIHPRIHILRWDIPSSSKEYMPWMRNLPSEVVEQFNDWQGHRSLDLIIVATPILAAELLSKLYSWRPHNSFVPLMCSMVMYSFGVKTPVPETYKALQSSGLLVSDLTFWQSKASFKRALPVLRKTMSSSALKTLLDNIVPTWFAGVPVDEIESVARVEKPKDRWVVSYGYSINTVYDFGLCFKMYDYLYCLGNEVKVLLSTSSTAAIIKNNDDAERFQKRYKNYFDITYALPQKEFWSRISEAHAFLFLAKNAEASFCVFEHFLLGCVGIFKESDFFHEACYDGYPYVGKSDVEIFAHLKYVLENYFEPDVQDVLRRQQEFIKSKWSVDAIMNGFGDSVDAANRKRLQKSVPSSLTEVCREQFGEMEMVEWDDFVAGIKNGTKYSMNIEDSMYLATLRSVFRKAMFDIGFEDDLSSDKPRFQKKKVKQ